MCAEKRPGDLSDLQKLQFDYAWKWFAYHADQRMKALNFMILTFGILATAIVAAIDKKLDMMAAIISLASFALAALFIALDLRNRMLVDDGRRCLRHLETTFIFKDGAAQLGLLSGARSRGFERLESSDIRMRLRHSWIIPGFAGIFALIFASALVYISVRSDRPITKVEITLPK